MKKRGQIKIIRTGPPKPGKPKIVKHSLEWFKKHFPVVNGN